MTNSPCLLFAEFGANMRYFRGRALKFAFSICFILCLAFLPRLESLAAPSVNLPAFYDANDLFQLYFKDSKVDDLHIVAGAMASGTNNVGSLWDVGKENQPSRVFRNNSAYVTISTNNWIRITSREWWVGFGRGKREEYRGNGDAAQLWIDLNSGVNTKQSYAPSVQSTRISGDWVGVGRYVAFKAGDVQGTAEIAFRSIDAEEYLARSLVGNVSGEDFEGMLRIESSNSSLGSVRGRGWSLDASAGFTIGNRWMGKFSVEGLAGKIRWRGLFVDDGWITSPGVFTDPEGFLHNCGGISGASWREDATLKINPCWRLDLILIGNPNLLIGVIGRPGDRTLPSVGAAWSQRTQWLPYFRCYPTQSRLEVGAVGRSWQFRISGDDWIFSSPKHAEIAVSAAAISF